MFPETSRFCSKYLDKVRIKYLKNICLYFYKYDSNIIGRPYFSSPKTRALHLQATWHTV